MYCYELSYRPGSKDAEVQRRQGSLNYGSRLSRDQISNFKLKHSSLTDLIHR